MLNFSLFAIPDKFSVKDFRASQNFCGTEIMVATYTGLDATIDLNT